MNDKIYQNLLKYGYSEEQISSRDLVSLIEESLKDGYERFIITTNEAKKKLKINGYIDMTYEYFFERNLENHIYIFKEEERGNYLL